MHAVRGRQIELDFVRGVAILMVLDYHSPAQWLSRPFSLMGFPNFGWAGVDVFFVLSGFLVGGLLVKERKIHGQIDTKRFLVRRAFKIWPQYYGYLAVILICGHRSIRDLWGNVLNIQNYTGGIPHTWSLAVEEHAYLFLMILLALVAHWNLRTHTLFWFLVFASLAVSAGRLLLSVHGHEVVTLTHTRVEGIFYGVLLAIVYHCRPETFQQLQALRWIWLVGLALSLVALRFQTAAPWSASFGWDVANLLGVCLLMLLYKPAETGAQRSLPYRVVAWIGVYSYGIYLWHVSVLAPTAAMAMRLPAWIRPAWTGIAPNLCGVVVGFLFTKLLEMPMLRLRDRLFPAPVRPVSNKPITSTRVAIRG